MSTEASREAVTRRQLLGSAGALGLAAKVAAAAPVAAAFAAANPGRAAAQSPTDGTLEAFFDTILPGRHVLETESGRPVTPGAIAGVDRDPGAVEADALLLARDPRIGFATLEPIFLADLEARSLLEGGIFINLSHERRERVLTGGLDFSNPTRTIWEAAAAVAFTAFCAAASTVEATRRTSVGYRVMGHPGTAYAGYRNASYGRRLARERTRNGNLG